MSVAAEVTAESICDAKIHCLRALHLLGVPPPEGEEFQAWQQGQARWWSAARLLGACWPHAGAACNCSAGKSGENPVQRRAASLESGAYAWMANPAVKLLSGSGSCDAGSAAMERAMPVGPPDSSLCCASGHAALAASPGLGGSALSAEPTPGLQLQQHGDGIVQVQVSSIRSEAPLAPLHPSPCQRSQGSGASQAEGSGASAAPTEPTVDRSAVDQACLAGTTAIVEQQEHQQPMHQQASFDSTDGGQRYSPEAKAEAAVVLDLLCSLLMLGWPCPNVEEGLRYVRFACKHLQGGRLKWRSSFRQVYADCRAALHLARRATWGTGPRRTQLLQQGPSGQPQAQGGPGIPAPLRASFLHSLSSMADPVAGRAISVEPVPRQASTIGDAG